jgi:hypothetical protein
MLTGSLEVLVTTARVLCGAALALCRRHETTWRNGALAAQLRGSSSARASASVHPWTAIQSVVDGATTRHPVVGQGSRGLKRLYQSRRGLLYRQVQDHIRLGDK